MSLNSMKIILSLVLLLISGVNSRFLKCPTSDGKFPVANSLCKSYYVCKNWKVTSEGTCPHGLKFNPAHHRCDYEELYYCAEGALEKYKRCKKSSGKFPKENSSCKTYYQCEKWQVIDELTCPPGQNFNPAHEWCDWEELYPCLEDNQSKECPKPSGLFPKPGSQCKSYYRCINGKSQEFRCPEDLNFNPVRGQCEWPELHPCDEKEEKTTPVTAETTWITNTTPQQMFTTGETIRSTASPETTKTEATESTKTEGTVGLQSTGFPTMGTSTRAEMGTTQTEDTGRTSEDRTTSAAPDTSTVSNTEEATLLTEEHTTLPPKGTSSGKDTPETIKEYTTSVTEETSEATSERHTKDPTQQTASDKPTEEALSSTVSEVLVSKTSPGDCTYSTTSVPTDSPGKVVCPRANGLFPHPTDKHKFLSCLEFVPTVMDCPNDLIYEPSLEACVWNKRNRS